MEERLYVRLDGDSLGASETTVPLGTMNELGVAPELAMYVASVAVYRETLSEPVVEFQSTEVTRRDESGGRNALRTMVVSHAEPSPIR